MNEIDSIVNQYYHNIGKPGSYFAFKKIKSALTLDGYRISDDAIKSALNKIESYNKFRKRYSTLPKHITKRFTHVSGPHVYLFGDSMRLPKGFSGPLKFCQIWIDAFSKKLSAEAIFSLKAKNSVTVFDKIIARDHFGILPEAVIVDRGRSINGYDFNTPYLKLH